LVEEEKNMNRQLESKLQELSDEHDKLKQEYERLAQMKAAYNADKKAYIDKINELECIINFKDQEKLELENKLHQ
jgi:hypothetical protein